MEIYEGHRRRTEFIAKRPLTENVCNNICKYMWLCVYVCVMRVFEDCL